MTLSTNPDGGCFRDGTRKYHMPLNEFQKMKELPSTLVFDAIHIFYVSYPGAPKRCHNCGSEQHIAIDCKLPTRPRQINCPHPRRRCNELDLSQTSKADLPTQNDPKTTLPLTPHPLPPPFPPLPLPLLLPLHPNPRTTEPTQKNYRYCPTHS